MRAWKNGVLMHDASYWRGFELESTDLPLGNIKADGAVVRADYVNDQKKPLFPVILLANKFIFVHPAAPVDFKFRTPIKAGLFHLFGGGLASFSLHLEIKDSFVSDSKKDCFVVSEWNEARALWYSLVKQKPIKICGLSVLEHLSCELAIPYFPRDYPCAESFLPHWQDRIQEFTLKWQRLPPAKRSQSAPSLPDELPTFTRCCSVKIVGRGVLQERAQIIDESGTRIGFVTAALSSSLLHGCSLGVGVLRSDYINNESILSIKNPNGIIRKATIKLL